MVTILRTELIRVRVPARVDTFLYHFLQMALAVMQLPVQLVSWLMLSELEADTSPPSFTEG
jgi:hypothetical protein